MATDQPNPQIEVASDEDWKSRVKAEDAALDEQLRGEKKPAEAKTTAPGASPEPGRSKSDASREFPTADFSGLVGMLSTQAMLGMGLLPNPATRKPEKQLPMARYFIDLIGVLEQKTAGHLDPEESATLDETLHSLRMAYIQCSREPA
jgi:hypothetical protein